MCEHSKRTLCLCKGRQPDRVSNGNKFALEANFSDVQFRFGCTAWPSVSRFSLGEGEASCHPEVLHSSATNIRVSSRKKKITVKVGIAEESYIRRIFTFGAYPAKREVLCSRNWHHLERKQSYIHAWANNLALQNPRRSCSAIRVGRAINRTTSASREKRDDGFSRGSSTVPIG